MDGTSAGEIGVNGLVQVFGSTSHTNSDSPKTESVQCPAGKMVVGTGYRISDGTNGSFPNQEANVVIKEVEAGYSEVSVTAVEEEPTSANWFLNPQAICATAP